MKKREKTELTISKIIDAAMIEFGSNGYFGGTINNICKTGINKGLIYHNFKDKDQLYLACLKISCDNLYDYIKKENCTNDLMKYMEARMRFFSQYPHEAHIFFEALLNPPKDLNNQIKLAMQKFDDMNELICRNTLNNLILRDGITEVEAVEYFKKMQIMFNGYFSSPAYHNISIEEKARQHEENIPKLFEFMLYGIAKDGVKK